MPSNNHRIATLFALWVLGASEPASAQFKDQLVQAPVPKPAERASVAGAYGAIDFGVTAVAQGSIVLPSTMTVPEERGRMLVGLLPTYGPGNGISEWGMGWANGLEITRYSDSEIDYVTDDFVSPWGRITQGNAGYWYPLGMTSRVRLWQEGGNWRAMLADGTWFAFSARVDADLGTYAWYVTDVVTATGDRTRVDYTWNTSGRAFVSEVRYGRNGFDADERVILEYEPIATPFVDYRSGAPLALDQRVTRVRTETLDHNAGAYAPRWAYDLHYDSDPWGPAFYLTSVVKRFASGSAEPAVTYQYDSLPSFLQNSQFTRLTALDGYLAQYGGNAIQPDQMSMIDIDLDGRVDIENHEAFALLHHLDGGWVSESLPEGVNVDRRCRPLPATTNPPRFLARMLGPMGEPHVVVSKFGATSYTDLTICNRKGEKVFRQSIYRNWELGPKTRLIDLNRDQFPEIVAVSAGQYQVLENKSTSDTFNFVAHNVMRITPVVTPAGVWFEDMNGDSIPDLVMRNSTGLVVWLGTGNFEVEASGRQFRFVDPAIGPMSGIDTYGVFFVDANKDGLTDVIATRSGYVALFINDGAKFVRRDVQGLGALASYLINPVIADLSGEGNIDVVATKATLPYRLALDRASTGLLVHADDGKGAAIDIGYARMRPENGVGTRHTVVASVTSKASGVDDAVSSYQYSGATMDSRGHYLLGFGDVVVDNPTGHHTASFHNDDAVRGVLLEVVDTDATRAPGLYRFQRHAFTDSAPFEGVRWYRPSIDQVGWGDTRTSRETSSVTTFSAYDDAACPSVIVTDGGHGTLQQAFQRASAPDIDPALHCLHSREERHGRHTDSSLDFDEVIALGRNGRGQLTTLTQSPEANPLVVQEVEYDVLWRPKRLGTASLGYSTIEYDTTTGGVTRVTGPDGVVSQATKLDPVTSSVLELSTDRGPGGRYVESYRYDPYERRERSWNDLDGSSATTPEERLTYAWSTATTPGVIRAATLVDAAGAAGPRYREQAALSAGDGGSLGAFMRSPGGWDTEGLTTRLRSELRSDRSRRFHVDDPGTAGTFPYASFADAASTVLASDWATGLGGSLASTRVIETGVSNERVGAMAVALSAAGAAELVVTLTENGRYVTRRGKDATGLVRWDENESGERTGVSYDASGRVVDITMPSGKRHRRRFDAYGRVALVARDDIASFTYQYDSVSGLLSRRQVWSAGGSLVSTDDWSYDGIGRPRRRTSTASGSVSDIIEFRYDGAGSPVSGQLGRLTSVSSDGYSRSDEYYPDGALRRREVRLADWRIVVWTYTYQADGSQRTVDREVRDVTSNTVIERVAQSFAYDDYGRMQVWSVNGVPTAVMTYDSEGKPARVDLVDGQQLVLRYDPTTHGASGYGVRATGWRSDVDWHFDARGLRQRELYALGDTGWSRQYQYDDRGYLSQVFDGQGSLLESYEYGTDGMLRRITDAFGSRDGISPRAGLSTSTGGVTYAFDGVGRLSQRGGLVLGYGPRGTLCTVQGGEHVVGYSYDDLGLRVLKRHDGVPVLGYLYGGQVTSTGFREPVRFFGQLAGVLENGAFRPLAADERGSVFGESDGSTNVASAYGARQLRPSVGELVDFAGLGYDTDLGTVRMGLRDYDPMAALWVSPDPLYLEGPEKGVESILELNLYGYVKNNPVNGTDPTGLGGPCSDGGLTEKLFRDATLPPQRGMSLWEMSVARIQQGVDDMANSALLGTAAYVHATLSGRPHVGGIPNGAVTSVAAVGFVAGAAEVADGVQMNPAFVAATMLPAGIEALAAARLTLPTLGASLGRAAEAGVLDGATFAQKTFGSMFSKGGAFAGRSVDEVAAALRSGAMSPGEVPIDYIIRDGNTLILNTRSAQALEAAGIPRSAWNAVNRTGQELFESMLTGQLERNGLTSAGTATVRRSGL